MNVGKAVRLIRTAKGVTQKGLANTAACSANYLSMVERGERQPSIDFVEQVSAALEVPAAEVFALAADEGAVEDPQQRKIVRRLRELMLMLNEMDVSGE